jgi:hypothetical protein
MIKYAGHPRQTALPYLTCDFLSSCEEKSNLPSVQMVHSIESPNVFDHSTGIIGQKVDFVNDSRKFKK